MDEQFQYDEFGKHHRALIHWMKENNSKIKEAAMSGQRNVVWENLQKKVASERLLEKAIGGNYSLKATVLFWLVQILLLCLHDKTMMVS